MAPRKKAAAPKVKKASKPTPPPGTRGSDIPHPVDVHVGGRVQLRRKLMGVSQETLAQKLQLTFQQVQKYERGTNRVSASRLYELAMILDVPVQFFFDDLDKTSNKFLKGKGLPAQPSGEGEALPENFMRDKVSIDIQRELSEMETTDKRVVLSLVRRLNKD